MRLNGASYDEIARAGGGIISTVSATRAASLDALVASALPRLDALIAEGVAHHRDQVRLRSGPRDRAEDAARRAAAGRVAPGDDPDHLSRRPCGAAGIRGPRRRLYRRGLPARRCGPPMPKGWSMPWTASARASPFRRTRSRGSLRWRARAWPAGQAACRAALRPRRRGAGRPPRRAVRRSSGISRARWRGRDGARRHRCGASCRAPSTPCAKPRPRRSPPCARHGVPMAVATDLQPRLLAAGLAVAGDEHGLHPVPPDPRRGPCGHHGQCRARARAAGPGRASRPGCGPIWPSGTCRHPAELAYRIGFNPLARPHLGGSDDADALPPARSRLPQLETIWRDQDARPGSTRAARAGDRTRRRARRGGRGRARRRSMASTPVSASWPAIKIAPARYRNPAAQPDPVALLRGGRSRFRAPSRA